MGKYFERRGIDNLVIAEVLQDDEKAYVTGNVRPLAPVAKVAKSTESSTSVSFYDNAPMFSNSSTGADNLEVTTSDFDLETLTWILGYDWDYQSGSMLEGERTIRHFAIGYRAKGTDGHYRYVWRLKGIFSIPSDEDNTENDSPDATNRTLTWTGLRTIHKFSDGKTRSAVTSDTRYDALDYSTYFDIVQTPDTLHGSAGVVTAPIFLPENAVFNENASIAMYSPSVKSDRDGIYYTTDGTEPNSSSNKYTAPILITSTTTFKAIAHVNGKPDSYVVTKKYTKV